MLASVNPADHLAGARLIEMLSPKTPWARSLWSIGITLIMAELHEACEAMRWGTLSEDSVRRLISSLLRTAGKDPALGDQEKAHLRTQLREVPRVGGVAIHGITQLRDLLESEYMLRWARAIRNPQASPERFARSIAAHLLDLGFSNSHLHKIVKHRLIVDAAPVSLSDLCEQLHEVIQNEPPRQFKVLVAFAQAPLVAGGFPDQWLHSDAIAQWLRRNNFPTSGLRPAGGFSLQVESRDPLAAADSAREIVGGFIARSTIGTRRHLVPLPHLWVEGHPEVFPFQTGPRGVRVEAIYREGLVFAGTRNQSVDAAIELLAHLENSSPTAAIAGGWGAIEGLLGEPGDRAAAADNLASLVACSIPRAELTGLSYIIERRFPDLAPIVRAGGNANRDRALAIAEMIIGRQLPDLPHFGDQAAVRRMQTLLHNPSRTLTDIQIAVSDAFHRLYRLRNLILHGGTTNSVALFASLRTVSKLAGAGIDRVAHGVYVQKLRPLELVARAKLATALVTPATAKDCIDLLGA